jgi:hypothetical protein
MGKRKQNAKVPPRAERQPYDALGAHFHAHFHIRQAMQSAVLVIDVQQGLCEGEAAAFDCEGTTARRALALGFPVTLVSDAHTSAGTSAISAQDVIAHHNATLGNISSFGPRVQTVPCHSIAFP